jgi:hypothetical protein
MKDSPLSVCLLVALTLLTFSSEKVFSMEIFFGKKSPDPAGEKAQARFQESRAEGGSGDRSSTISRGPLGPGTGPSEKRDVAQEDENDTTVAGESYEGQNEGEDVDIKGVTDRQLAYLCLQQLQDKHSTVQTMFAQAGLLSRDRSIHSMALDFVKNNIDALTKTLEQAEQKPSAEQADAFAAAVEVAKNMQSSTNRNLDSMMGDVQYTANHQGLGMYLALVRDQEARSQARK